MRLELAIQGKLGEHMRAETAAGARAVSQAMRTTAGVAKTKLRAQIRSAGMGSRLANTWRAEVYPSQRPSLNAAALIYSRAPVIIEAFDKGVTIRSRSGFWLAIPLPAAGKTGLGRKRITPGGFERRTGLKLRFVYRRNGPSMLVADNARITKGGNARANVTRSKKGTYTRLKGRTTVPVFLLYPQVKMPKKLDVEKVRAQADRDLARTIVWNWNMQARRK